MEGFIVGRKSFLSGKLLLALFAAGSISTAVATPGFPACPTDSLANYVTNTFSPPGGCAIGVLDYFDFSYHPLSNAPLASAIQVTPFGAGFSIGPVSAAAGVTVQFEIDYDIVIDPAPIITGGDLGLDPPTGNVVVTERFCNDTSYTFASGTCLGGVAPETLTVGTLPPNPISARINFVHPATVSQQVGIVFTLTGGTGGASFDGLNAASVVNIPEPAPAAGLLLGMLALGGGCKLRKQRAH
jgi:hypothetical protein